MKQLLCTLWVVMCIGNIGYAQQKKTDEIMQKGRLLFRMEKGSWYGTDHFMEKFANKRDSLGGYVSYENEDDHTITTVFINKYKPDTMLVRYVFDSIPKPQPLGIDTLMKPLTNTEKQLFAIRAKTLEVVNKDTTGFFTFYKNSSYNFIPLLSNGISQVYIITGSNEYGKVLLGNDYLVTFTKEGEVHTKEKLHNTILSFPYKGDTSKLVATTHSHIVTKYITETDVCTLLLYKDYVEWTKHYVIGEKEVCIFDLEKEKLYIMKRKAWDKIYADDPKKE